VALLFGLAVASVLVATPAHAVGLVAVTVVSA
jgi:hypothetical protein